MHSSTQSYVALQGLYRQQYVADLQRFAELLAAVLKEVGLPLDAIPAVEIETFVKNVNGVAIVKGSALGEAKAYEGRIREHIADDFQQGSEPPVGICVSLAFLASEQFYKAFNRWPGQDKGSEDIDVAEVERFAQQALAGVHMDVEGPPELPDELSNAIGEVVRGGFLTIPTTAAFIGGIAAQEVIKLVTNQYAPLDNTAAVDLVKSSIEKLKL